MFSSQLFNFCNPTKFLYIAIESIWLTFDIALCRKCAVKETFSDICFSMPRGKF